MKHKLKLLALHIVYAILATPFTSHSQVNYEPCNFKQTRSYADLGTGWQNVYITPHTWTGVTTPEIASTTNYYGCEDWPASSFGSPGMGIEINPSSNIFLGQDNNIYYISNYSGNVGYLMTYYFSGTHEYIVDYVLGTSSGPQMKANGGIVFSSATQGYCIGQDQKVYTFWKDVNQQWHIDLMSATQPVLANSTAGLMEYQGTIIYMGTDGYLYKFVWNGSQWVWSMLSSGQNTTMNAAARLAKGDGNVYALGNNGLVYRFTLTGSIWNFYQLAGQTGNSNPNALGGLLTAAGKVYCIGQDNKVYNFSGANSGSGGWTYSPIIPISSQPQNANVYNKLALFVNQVIMTNTSGILYKFSGGTQSQLSTGQNVSARITSANASIPQVNGTTKLYFVGQNHKVYVIEKVGSLYTFNPLLTNSTELQPSDITNFCFSAANDIIYYKAYHVNNALSTCSSMPRRHQLSCFFKTVSTIDYSQYVLTINEEFSTYTTVNDVFNTYHNWGRWKDDPDWGNNGNYCASQSVARRQNNFLVDESPADPPGDQQIKFRNMHHPNGIQYPYNDYSTDTTGCQHSQPIIPSRTTSDDWLYIHQIRCNCDGIYFNPNEWAGSCPSDDVYYPNCMTWYYSDGGIRSVRKDTNWCNHPSWPSQGLGYDTDNDGMPNLGYGLFEVKAKVPVAPGLWPSIWLVSAWNEYESSNPNSCDYNGYEIDILEYFGNDPFQITNNFWYEDPAAPEDHNVDDCAMELHTPDMNWSLGYHIWALEYTPNYLRYFVDGKELRKIRHNIPPGTKFDIILGGGVSRYLNNYPDPDFYLNNDVAMYVDYFKYYKYNPSGGGGGEGRFANAVISNFKVQPNPSSGIFTIDFPENLSTTASLYVTNILGNVVFENKSIVPAGKMEINLSSLPKGIYFLNVLESNGRIYFEKIVIQ